MTDNAEMQNETEDRQRILVADDEASIRRILETRLKMVGYDVVVAEDGEEAINVFNKTNPDLVVLDVMMPKINGFKISRLLKYDAKYKNIPIIMLTARSQDSDKQIGEETGADVYITKPFDLDDVVSTVAKLLKEKENN